MWSIIFYVPLGYFFILVLFILGNIKKNITSVTKVKGLKNHELINSKDLGTRGLRLMEKNAKYIHFFWNISYIKSMSLLICYAM